MPVRQGEDEYPVAEPENQNPLPDYAIHTPGYCERRVIRDLQNQSTHYHIVDDTGEEEIPGHGMQIRHHHEDHWKIDWYDPLSATCHTRVTSWMSRDEWSIRTETASNWRCDATHFHIEATVRAFENDALINERCWQNSIKRDFM